MSYTKKEIMNLVEQACKENDCRPIYVTYTGSKLHGTDNENSDTDVTVIYLPSRKSMYLGTMKEGFKFESNKNQNSKNDIDIDFISIQKFSKQLMYGSPKMIEIFLSEKRKDTILFKDDYVTQSIFYPGMDGMFRTKNIKRLTNLADAMYSSYCKSNIELEKEELINILEQIKEKNNPEDKVQKHKELILSMAKNKGFVFNIFINGQNGKENLYSTVLSSNSIEKSIELIKFISNPCLKGERTEEPLHRQTIKSGAQAIRVLSEFKQILLGDLHVYPSKEAEKIKKLKEAEVVTKKELAEIMDKEYQDIRAFLEEHSEEWNSLKDEPSSMIAESTILEVISYDKTK